MQPINTNPYAPFMANGTHSGDVRIMDCVLDHPDILLRAPKEPDTDTDCQLDLSPEALTNAGLTYFHNLRPFEKTKFIDSHIKAAARCFDLASRQFDYPAQLSHREKSLARELKSLDKIDMQNASYKERLALAHHKMGVLRVMGLFCSSDSASYFDYLNKRIYQEALTIARVYQRQAESWLQRQSRNTQPKGRLSISPSRSLNIPALLRQAHFLIVAAEHASGIYQQIRLYNRAVNILENVYKNDPIRCVEDPVFNLLNMSPSGFAWHGEFDQEKTLLIYVKRRLQSLSVDNIPANASLSIWETFTSIFTWPIRKLFGR